LAPYFSNLDFNDLGARVSPPKSNMANMPTYNFT